MTPEDRTVVLVKDWKKKFTNTSRELPLASDLIYLRELATAAIRAAVEEEREQCCKDICPTCYKGVPVTPRFDYKGNYYHMFSYGQEECGANDIRIRARSQGQGEKEG